jgi:2-polyprenyl-3-methyl-5-hydroxy-6-metoxy-1,4-benzoquinol methylase
MTEGPVPRYDEIADFYDGVVGDDLEDPIAGALFELLSDPDGLRVLDLACGQGRLSRELARRGASVVGLDISSALLARARAAEADNPLGLTYVEGDATSPRVLDGETFEAVTCHFGLSDTDDLRAVTENIVRLLEPDGLFLFSILHPCFPGWGDDAPSSWPPGESYYSEKWWRAENSGFRGKVGANHRMLSTYLNTVAQQGLAIERIAEPRPVGDWVSANPSEDLVPAFLVVRCRHVRRFG